MKRTRIVRFEADEGSPMSALEVVHAIKRVQDDLGHDVEPRLYGEHGRVYKVEGSVEEARDPKLPPGRKLPRYIWADHSQACQATATANSRTPITCRCIVPSAASYRVEP